MQQLFNFINLFKSAKHVSGNKLYIQRVLLRMGEFVARNMFG